MMIPPSRWVADYPFAQGKRNGKTLSWPLPIGLSPLPFSASVSFAYIETAADGGGCAIQCLKWRLLDLRRTKNRERLPTSCAANTAPDSQRSVTAVPVFAGAIRLHWTEMAPDTRAR